MKNINEANKQELRAACKSNGIKGYGKMNNAQMREALLAVAKPAPSPRVNAVNETSSVKKPTKLVWEIAQKMKEENPNVRRKDVIAACQEAGIAFYTARTQYQLWFQASKNS